MKKMRLMQGLAILAVVALALMALGVAAAQDNTTATTPGFLGIRFVQAEGGVLVVEVVADSPAATAGLKVGDLILTVNGDSVTAETIQHAIQTHVAGDTLALGIERRGEAMDLSATLAESPAAVVPGQEFNFVQPMMTERPYLGVTLDAGDNGVLITQVAENSPAAAAGLEVNDLVKQANDTVVKTPAELAAVVQGMAVGDKLTLTIDRSGETLTLDATLGSAPVMTMPFGEGFGRDNMFGLRFADGKLEITNLPESSPLYEAGLRSGDKITAINGQSLSDMTAMFDLFSNLKADGNVTVTVDRDGSSQDIDVPAANLIGSFGFFGEHGMFGMPEGMNGFFPFFFHQQTQPEPTNPDA
ncbi:MAG: PDZ domain-containing protein [Anaerolineae bacterium]|nr:PDZ domain-containing protein [Anaerolineae bacterium]